MADIKCPILALVCILSSSALNGEDLKTLDRTTYSNITDISIYPNQVFFNCDGERTYVLITNLPEDFRSKHGIILKTNAPASQAVSPQVNPTDLFLRQNRESSLYQLESERASTTDPIGITTYTSWFIDLRSAEVSLSANTTTSYHSPTSPDRKHSEQMHFDIGQEDFISRVFAKFIEWDDLARTTRAENVEKEIARRPINKSASAFNELFPNGCSYKFVWQDGRGTLHVDDSAPYGGYFEAKDIIHFQSLLKALPSMKERLVTGIRNKEAQKDLFR